MIDPHALKAAARAIAVQEACPPSSWRYFTEQATAAITAYHKHLSEAGDVIVPFRIIEEWFADEMREYPGTEYRRHLEGVRDGLRASEQIAEYRIEAWINKELGEDK
jgi:hypothetical protein